MSAKEIFGLVLTIVGLAMYVVFLTLEGNLGTTEWLYAFGASSGMFLLVIGTLIRNV
jgi:hypothetical protein